MKKISAPFAAAALAACALLAGVHQAARAASNAEPAIDAHYGAMIEAYTQDKRGDVYFEIFNEGPKKAKKAPKPLSGGAQAVDNLKLAIDV